jgi:hypothetical protein
MHTIITTRPDGTLDVFGAVLIAGGSFELYHSAIGSNGGTVISKDFLGVDPIMNLFEAGWRSNNSVLYVRAFTTGGSVLEWVWKAGLWSGPVTLKQ